MQKFTPNRTILNALVLQDYSHLKEYIENQHLYYRYVLILENTIEVPNFGNVVTGSVAFEMDDLREYAQFSYYDHNKYVMKNSEYVMKNSEYAHLKILEGAEVHQMPVNLKEEFNIISVKDYIERDERTLLSPLIKELTKIIKNNYPEKFL